MTSRDRDRLAAPVVGMYWLLLALGLALYGVAVSTEPLVPLALGALLGSVLGHALGLRNVRLWLVVLFVIGILYIGIPVSPKGAATDHFWMAFVPAVLCAYASLAERWSLAAIWFPVVTWMLTILDRTQGARAMDGLAIVLLGLVAVGFFAFLRVRETRRIGLWRTAAAVPLASTKLVRRDRESPMRPVVRAAWSLAITASAFAMTAFVAPALWRIEGKQHVEPVAPLAVGLPCCPEHEMIERTRVREYLDLGRGHDKVLDHWNDCRPCEGEADVAAYEGPIDGYVAPSGGYVDPGEAAPAAPAMPAAPQGTYEAPPPEIDHMPTVVPPAPEPAPMPTPAPRPALVEMPPAPPPQVLPPQPPPVEPPPPPAPVPPPHVTPPPAHAAATHGHALPPSAPHDSGWTLLHWLAILVGGALFYQVLSLAIRPLRRALTLRHLRRPFWDETVDQRISNSWQLALVGLRDAGWRYDGGEAPREFAHRVGVADLERCATILERARYGVAVADTDLDEMATSAEGVYQAARGKVGPIARALAWLRWPLA